MHRLYTAGCGEPLRVSSTDRTAVNHVALRDASSDRWCEGLAERLDVSEARAHSHETEKKAEWLFKERPHSYTSIRLFLKIGYIQVLVPMCRDTGRGYVFTEPKED